jgi:transcriptional regulator with XRE-family HTH domain
MNDAGVGRVLRAVRRRRGWRQTDVARAAGLSQQTVSLIETGEIESSTLKHARRVASVLGVTLAIEPRGRGGDLARLLDERHAAVVELVVGHLRTAGFDAIVEYSFNVFGDRGSVDIAAWHPGARALLIVEAKSAIVDLQDLIGALDRKVRVVPPLLARERGWRAMNVGRVVALPEGSTNRDAVERHAAMFSAALPARTREVVGWVRKPAGPLAGFWFLRDTNRGGGAERRRVGTRVRRPTSS